MKTRSNTLSERNNKRTKQKQPSTGVLRESCSEKCSKFTGEHLCRSVILIKMEFLEIEFRYGCSPVNLLHIFRTPFSKNSSEELLSTVKPLIPIQPSVALHI